MADPAEQSYDRANEFGWKEGDIEILEPGTVEPLLSEEDLDRISEQERPALILMRRPSNLTGTSRTRARARAK